MSSPPPDKSWWETIADGLDDARDDAIELLDEWRDDAKDVWDRTLDSVDHGVEQPGRAAEAGMVPVVVGLAGLAYVLSRPGALKGITDLFKVRIG